MQELLHVLDITIKIFLTQLGRKQKLISSALHMKHCPAVLSVPSFLMEARGNRKISKGNLSSFVNDKSAFRFRLQYGAFVTRSRSSDDQWMDLSALL